MQPGHRSPATAIHDGAPPEWSAAKTSSPKGALPPTLHTQLASSRPRTMPHAFILGGTGQVGLATANRLLEAGWSVTLAHRGRRPVPSEPVDPDLVQPHGALALFVEVRFDRHAAEREAGADRVMGRKTVILIMA
jgi:hypothetical protein